MLLTRTLHGNLRTIIYSFFDADHQGRKDDPASYREIARQIKESRANILFLSDSIKGSYCCRCCRVALNCCRQVEKTL